MGDADGSVPHNGFEGLDPVTGRERRSWHPTGTDRAAAEVLTERLAAGRNGRDDEVRSLSFGAYLTTQWLPGKKLELATSTYRGYERSTELHILPGIGKVGLRRLRPHHVDRLYDEKLNPTNGRRALAPKTVYEIHLVIRGALSDAVRRGLVNCNVALGARSPLQRSFPTVATRYATAGCALPFSSSSTKFPMGVRWPSAPVLPRPKNIIVS